jgi:hypothetical protein
MHHLRKIGLHSLAVAGSQDHSSNRHGLFPLSSASKRRFTTTGEQLSA